MLAAAPARADDRASVERGRSAGRALLLLRAPRGCAIALVHERCVSDVDAFLGGQVDKDFAGIPNIGPRPASGLRAFVADGDRLGFDRALSYINTRAATPAMWSADPRDAALFDAGLNGVAMRAAMGDSVTQLFAILPIIDLSTHADRIPAESLPIPVDPIRKTVGSDSAAPTVAAAFGVALANAVDAALPPPPLANLTYPEGPRGDAQLGVASATISELIDTPSWLAQTDAQAFVDRYIARLAMLQPDRSAQIATLRSALRPGANFAHDATLDAQTAAIVPLLGKGKPHSAAILLGSLAAQGVFNAAAYRERQTSGMVSRVIADGGELDADVPGWREARRAAGVIDPSDWTAQYRSGLLLVGLIIKAGSH